MIGSRVSIRPAICPFICTGIRPGMCSIMLTETIIACLIYLAVDVSKSLG
jgi:hypothetical protein